MEQFDTVENFLLVKFCILLALYFRRVQDIDGGFFEKFGLLLGQKSKEMLATATLHTIGLGRKISSGIAPVRLAQESDIDNSISSLHDEIISQLENPMAKKESFIKEYSGLNVRKHDYSFSFSKEN